MRISEFNLGFAFFLRFLRIYQFDEGLAEKGLTNFGRGATIFFVVHAIYKLHVNHKKEEADEKSCNTVDSAFAGNTCFDICLC